MKTKERISLKALPPGWEAKAEKLNPEIKQTIGVLPPGIYPGYCSLLDSPTALVVTEKEDYYRLYS